MKANAIKLSDNVYWVGAIDWGLKEFHGYETRGTTYNAYLILGDKITLIDTVKADFRDELLARISSVIEPSKIDYIVSNHSEMDHTGSLPSIIDLVKPDKVFASKEGAKALAEHFSLPIGITPVSDGEKLDLGGKTLSFIETRMVHWPDSMFSYLVEDGILFSQDAFGMHLASSERFDNEISEGALDYEAAKYYANIINPFSNIVSKVIARLADSKLNFNIIAPDHGPVWQAHINRILDLYNKWSSPKPTLKAIIVYDTMWHSTEKMAFAIGEGLQAGGAKPKIMPLATFHASDIVTETLDAGAMIVGSPTFNSGPLPSVAGFLQYARGLKIRHVIGASFGSYGWSPGAVKQIGETLSSMRIELVGEGVQAKYTPSPEALDQCYQLGSQIADKLKEISKG